MIYADATCGQLGSVGGRLTQSQLAVTESARLGGGPHQPQVEYLRPKSRKSPKCGPEDNTALYCQEKKVLINIAACIYIAALYCQEKELINIAARLLSLSLSLSHRLSFIHHRLFNPFRE